MAARKTLKFLPGIFQTDVNDKFLSATMDQLVSEPNLKTINGYIGRQFAPTYRITDSYIIEDTVERQNYQLEPSVIVRDEQKNVTFFASYVDLLNKIKHYGGLIDNHSRLFDNEYYSFDPRISYDKFVNFTQYYWLPNGPDAVSVNTGGVELTNDFIVTRDATTNQYHFETSAGHNDTIILSRGGSYTFTVNQPGVPFWIQTELGLDGRINATPTISSREVYGVENNGIDVGTITFNVPQADAQSRFTSMLSVYNVDYATPLAYSELHGQTLEDFLSAHPEYAGITGQLDGKSLIFVDQDQLTNYGEAAWTVNGNVVPDSQRYGVWRVQFSSGGIANPTISLVYVQNVALDEKVYIKYGVQNANREFYKDYDGFLHRVPVISSVQNTLYFQDGENANNYGSIKLVESTGWNIDVTTDILGQKNYTSPNGVKFTSGLKIRFDQDVTPANYQEKEYYVENVGDSIRLVDTELLVTPELYNDELALNYPGQAFPDYITIKRDTLDLNPWSRNNRWFHREIITLTAEYNGVQPTFDQTLRAQRPIVQFEGDLQLLNNGRIGKHHIDILDTTTFDAFNDIEGEILTTAFGVTLFDGMRVLFAVDNDPLVRDKIYVLNLVQYDLDSQGLPTGPVRVKLTIAEDGDSEAWDTVVVTGGNYKGSQWWYDGTQWNESQQKTGLNQDPLFDVFDSTGVSLSTYPRSTFNGTKVFGYKRNTAGVNDTVLGFALSYRNFGTQGDIEFQNYFDTDTYSYVVDQTVYNPKVSTGFLHNIVDRNTVTLKNQWKTVVEPSHQYQLLTYSAGESSTVFQLDITPNVEATIPYLKVYKNNTLLNSTSDWTYDSSAKTVAISATLAVNDKIDILVYSDEVSEYGSYQVPANLDLNAQNLDLDTVTLGQVRNHLVALSQNSKDLVGNVLSSSNLRDIEIKQQGGNILQHSAPVPYASLFLLDDTANFVDSVRFAQREYTKFKNKFLELSATLPGIDPTDAPASVDLILTEINKIKNNTFPWFYSDMVPYGPLKIVVGDVGYVIFDPFVRSYEITNVFSSTTLSNQAVLVYLNNEQLILGLDYTFDTDRPAITLTDRVNLEIDDILAIVEYSNTDGNYIPETPTKLGLFPKFIPEIFLDDTYRDPINVIRGHDGSITPAFDDYRDDFILELEKRIFNNIKVSDVASYRNVYAIIPGKFRASDYSISEANQILSGGFLSWIGNNVLDFSTNSTFESNDPFTWNYAQFFDRIDGEALPGSWRACFKYFYDTDAPHQRPWEMLGFSIKPSWWEDYYGPAPYTGGNTLLWDDLEAGRIVAGPRAGIDTNFARPGLSQIIPVDENGTLKPPSSVMANGFNSKYTATAWAIGQQGPTETAWRRSSDFAFSVQIAVALAKPARYFGLLSNSDSYAKNPNIGQFLTAETNHHLTQTDPKFNGDSSTGTAVRAAGYLNWIADYLTNRGINPSTVITPMLTNYTVNLAYKMSGFTDPTYVQVLAEQSSPSSTNASVVVPAENYNIHLYKSTPVDNLVYSGVIVEKTTNGYTVRGYDVTQPYFTIIPSVVNNHATKVTVLNAEAVIYFDYQPVKLTVPYGYEFKTRQQVADFLISYERFLVAQGFQFSTIVEELAEVRNFTLSVKEFLFWAQQGWAPGSILVLSPIGETVNVNTSGSIVDTIRDSQYGTKVIDQNFKLVKNNNYNIMRTPTSFKLTVTNDEIIGMVELDLVQYEHVLIFDNTTVFNDIIYKPELGNRQYRLKLIGQKTAEWDGSLSAPGFMYNSGAVDSWQPGKDYLKGDLVEYKDKNYVAMSGVVASDTFDFSTWKISDYGQFDKGMLPNFSSLAVKGQSYYNPYGYFNDADQIKYSHGLIGFKPRQYLDDLGINETSQIEFYKGYIKQKGSANAFDALTNAQFNNLASAIDYYEEWAVRIGEYGALDINPYVEIALDEKAFSVNPATAEFVDNTRASEADGVTIFSKQQLYKSTDQYTGAIALERDGASDYNNDIPTAGYVNIDDVDMTIFDINEYNVLNDQIDLIGSGYTIWVAKDFTQNWNVYRVTETDTNVLEIANSLNGFITLTTDAPHGLTVNSVFMLRNFDPAFDGFYQVYSVNATDIVTVQYAGDTEELTTLNGLGTLFVLDSLRFDFMETARKYTPPHGWKEGEKIWIDEDAATSFVQGQPYETDSGLWKVYEKTMPWQSKQRLLKGETEYVAGDGFGTSVKLSADGLLAVSGSPLATVDGVQSGLVSTFAKDSDGEFVQSFTLVPDANVTAEFGHHLDLSTETIAVGAPGSNSDNGFVYIYNKLDGLSTYTRGQVIAGNLSATGDRFGTSVSLDEFGDWLYIGAPGNDRVYVYGLNKFVTEQSQVTSINNRNIITLAANIANVSGAVVGDHLLQNNTGADVEILAFEGSNVVVSSVTNLSTVTGNLTLVTVNIYGDYLTATDIPYKPLQTYSTPYRTTITLTDITPDVADDANSLVITSRDRTYIPYIDYILNGSVVEFITNGNVALPAIIEQNDISIKQAPYYTYVTTIQGPTGSEFGYAVDSSLDGAQLGVGTPGDTVNVAVRTDGVTLSVPVGTPTANVVSYTEYVNAGSVFVYDRVIEAFTSTGGQDYVTTGNIGAVHRVSVDNVEVTNYFVVGSNIIRFISPPSEGQVVYIETNEFNLLEKLIGIDSLEGGLSAIQNNARFGTSLTICSNNCAIYVGAPYYDNGTTYNTGAVWKFHNRGRLYGTNTGQTANPTFTPGDTIRLDNFEVEITGTTLDEVVDDINSAGILGVSAVNENSHLRLNSDKTVAKNLLRILSGSGTVFEDAGMAVFAFMQIIINPYNTANEYFGSKVILARNAYMLVISSERGTTNNYATFDDNTTTLDNDTTGFFDSIKQGGSVYIYELYDDPRDAVEDPGRYAFAQQLNPGDLNFQDQFGAAIDIVGDQIIVSAPGDDTSLTNAGSVYIFENPNRTRGWNLIRYQQPTVDIDSVNRIYLYDSLSNTILTNLEFIDPVKGKIPGQAEQEIDYKTAYDPAQYNQGTNARANINNDIYWSDAQVGRVWWDLDRVRYVDYEQDSLTYRSINWGRLFPGSTIEILEWVESTVLPSQYVENGFEGTPKYEDDSAYVEILYVDSMTNIITSKYFFWVKGKTTVDTRIEGRKLPIQTIQNLIENPKANGVAYAAIIKNNAMIVYNVGNYLSANDTILHLDYEIYKNSSIIHSEYELLQRNNPLSFIPEKISKKLIDSLSGIDATGAIVPDPTLSLADRLGVSYRPRQTMFVDRLAALDNLVAYVNGVLIKKPIARQYDLNQLNSSEPIPNIKLGEYDQSVTTEQALEYIDVGNLPAGHKVLVETDTTQDNLWVLYRLAEDKTWIIDRVQGYKASLYWDYVDWYAEGYGPTTQIEYSVPTLIDALKLSASPGEEILVRVAIGDRGQGWNLLAVNDAGGFDVVGIENGTVQLKDSLGDFANNDLGYSNQGFDVSRYDQNPNIEIRIIMQALKEDIFINELEGQYNKLFFVMMNYLFGEQKYVDWIFKTSFISVTHQLRELSQIPNYIKDNQSYYQEYINEVKPYSSKIREYLIAYNSLDEYSGSVTDFDLPPYYDTDTKIFRSPSGEFPAKDSAIWQTEEYNQWYNNRRSQISNIDVVDGGAGYTSEPTVIITGTGTGATARAIFDNDLGIVTGVIVTNPGSGYYTTPSVTINGGNTRPARAYAVLENNQVRSINTTMKFDRTGYNTSIRRWSANTAYTSGEMVAYNGAGYTVNANLTTGSTFIADDYTVVLADDYANANDRIMAYYNPLDDMPQIETIAVPLVAANAAVGSTGIFVYGQISAVQVGMKINEGGAMSSTIVHITPNIDDNVSYIVTDKVQNILSGATITASRTNLGQLLYGVDYPGVQVTGVDFGLDPRFGGGRFDDVMFDNVQYDESGNPLLDDTAIDTIIRSNYSDVALGTRAEDIDVDGGAYVDTYSSHAPEEFVPGIVFDTLDMQVYTKITTNDEILGYRIFNNMLRETSYLRMADAYSTVLAQDLNITDTEIHVLDAGKMPTPSPSTGVPGVVFINNERITYFTIDLVNNVLGQIRRGTQGTAAPVVHLANTLVVDGSLDQVIPGTVAGNVTLSADTTYTSTLTPAYKLKLTGNVTANVGDIITQTVSGTNVTVVGTNVSQEDIVWVNGINTFDFVDVTLYLTSNVTVFVGDVITQTDTGASMTVAVTDYNTPNITAQYDSLTALTPGNISINGGANIVLISTQINTSSELAIAINGTTSNVHPVTQVLQGTVDELGQVTINANLTLNTANVWYNVGTYTATDGTGFEGATTEAVEFLKASAASYTVGIITDQGVIDNSGDAVNILITEDNELLIEE